MRVRPLSLSCGLLFLLHLKVTLAQDRATMALSHGLILIASISLACFSTTQANKVPVSPNLLTARAQHLGARSSCTAMQRGELDSRSQLCSQVTCGSTIKLAHVSTKVRLHSHEVAYSRGSQQQSVTGFPTSDDAQSYWVVHGPKVRGNDFILALDSHAAMLVMNFTGHARACRTCPAHPAPPSRKGMPCGCSTQQHASGSTATGSSLL